MSHHFSSGNSRRLRKPNWRLGECSENLLESRAMLSAHMPAAHVAAEISPVVPQNHAHSHKPSLAGTYDTDAEETLLSISQHGKHLTGTLTTQPGFPMLGSGVTLSGPATGSGKLKGKTGHLILTGPGSYVNTGDTGTVKITLSLTKNPDNDLEGPISIELNGYIDSKDWLFVFLNS